MGTDARHMVIVGAGLAGVRAAETLRSEGFDGRITLLGSDPANPYDHVPLSKDYLRGERGYHRLFLHDESFYADSGIDLRRGTAVAALDVARHEAVLVGGETLSYDRLLLATGSRNRRLRLPGADLDGILQLRTLADADAIRAALAAARRLVVVGAGFVGCEIAASARQLGLEVTLVGRGRLPMLGALGPLVAGFYRDLHVAHGVELHLGADVAGFEGTGGRVRAVMLADGTRLPADAVVAGIGAVPDVELAAAAGIPVEGGIETDRALAAGAPDVFAAGDVALVPYPFAGRRLRVEHFATALTQGPVAARNMLGENLPYAGVPFFFSDQFGVWMECTGHASPGAEPVVRGDVATGEFVVFWLADDVLQAAVNVTVRGVPDLVTPVIATGGRVDRRALVDPATDLDDLFG